MKRLITILLVSSFILVYSGCNKATNIPVFYGQFSNAQRTSYRDVSGLKETPGKVVVWRINKLSEAYEALLITMNAPTIEGDKVYLVSGTIITVARLDTGEEIWRKDYSIPPPSAIPPQSTPHSATTSEFDSLFLYSPVIYDDKIIILGGYPQREFLLVLNKNTGEPLWKSKVIGGMATEPCSEHPLVINGKVYLAATDSDSLGDKYDAEAGIYVWDVDTGKLLDKIFLEPVAEPIVGKYRSISPSTASLAADGANIYGVTRFINDSTYRTYIFCYDTSRKKFTWFEPIGEEGFESPGNLAKIAVDKDFIAVCMVGDQWMGKEPQLFIKVFDKASHNPLWQNITKTNKKLAPVLTLSDVAIHNGKLYAMLMDKRFVCFDMKMGKEIWSFKDKDWQSEWWNKWNAYEDCFLENDLVITTDVIYFNTGNAIYAFGSESGKLFWHKLVEKGNIFLNIMPVDKGLIVRYQDIQIGYDTPQKPVVCELWK